MAKFLFALRNGVNVTLPSTVMLRNKIEYPPPPSGRYVTFEWSLSA